jgi:predicted nucleic acid-binding protein
LSAYADTSFLYGLYVQEAHSAKAATYMAGTGSAPLLVTALGRFELFNAIRLSVFRRQLNARTAEVDLQTVESDIRAGVLDLVACDWPAIHAEAERLSAKHTIKRGHRAMDVLHVAIALRLGAADFLTFDQNQAKLASAEGLVVEP